MLLNLPMVGLNAILASTGLVSDLGLDAAYWAVDDGVFPLTCVMTFTIKRDGTWTMTIGGDDQFTNGTTFSGNWAAVPSATVGDGFQVRYSSSGQSNAPTITNGASSFTTISGNITYVVSKGAGAQAAVNMTVELQPIGGPVGLTDTCEMRVTGG